MDSEDVKEIKRHFGVVAEGLEKKIQLVGEAVSGLGAKVDRLEQKMDRGFEEVKAMIKFSYSELDRRVSSLEASVTNLDSRLQKLEAR